jgi:hypothetical protein
LPWWTLNLSYARLEERFDPAFFGAAVQARSSVLAPTVSDAQPCFEQARLPAGNLHFRTVAKLRMQPPIHAQVYTLDEIQIYELASIGAEESIRIKTLLES